MVTQNENLIKNHLASFFNSLATLITRHLHSTAQAANVSELESFSSKLRAFIFYGHLKVKKNARRKLCCLQSSQKTCENIFPKFCNSLCKVVELKNKEGLVQKLGKYFCCFFEKLKTQQFPSELF